MPLDSKKCVPCEGGVPPLFLRVAREMMKELQPGWRLQEGAPPKLARTFTFKNFMEAMEFVNTVAKIAEREGHHPDIAVHYNRVVLELYTHAINGLHENDFIVAAKIDRLGF